MTNEEAKKMLEAKLKCFIAETSGTNHDCNMRLCDGCSLNYEQGNMREQKQALDMAIKALEQQPSEDCRNCKKWNECPCGKEGHENGTSIGYSIGECKDYEPCEDCISRQAVLDTIGNVPDHNDGMVFEALSHAQRDVALLPSVTPTNEDIKEAYLKGYDYGVKDWFKDKTQPTDADCTSVEPIQWYSQNKDGYLVKGAYSKDEAYVKLTDVYEKLRTSKDCISREVVDKLSRDLVHVTRDKPDFLCNFWEGLNALPSVTPERPKGKWIHWTDDYKDYCTCSECGYGEEGEVLLKDKTPYCPYCGAEMEGKE